MNKNHQISVHFSDGRPSVFGFQAVNEALHDIGLRASKVVIPEEAKPILSAAKERPTTPEEQKKLVELFYLHRGELLEQIKLAGREPEMHRGGYLEIAQRGMPPYPKIYDVQAMSPEMKHHALTRFSKLHTNMAEDGTGVDEVMTVVAGGPFTHYFALNDGVVARLSISEITLNDTAVRLSYNGIIKHAALMNPAYGLIVAFAHGPKEFDMVFEDPSLPHPELMDTNPWIDYSFDVPKPLDKAIGSK
ncbi:MAG: hypothetical protein ACK5NC_15655 [Vibrio sp.]